MAAALAPAWQPWDKDRPRTWETAGGLWKKGKGDQPAIQGFGNMASNLGDLQQLGDTGMYGWRVDPSSEAGKSFLSGMSSDPNDLKAWGMTDPNVVGRVGASGTYGPGYAQFKIVKDYQGNQYAVPQGYESYGAHLFSPSQMGEQFGQYATGQTPFYSTQEEADAGAAAAANAPPTWDTLQEQFMPMMQDYMSRGRGLLTGGGFTESPEYQQTKMDVEDIIKPELQSRGLLTSGPGLRGMEDAWTRSGIGFEERRGTEANEFMNSLMGLLTGGSQANDPMAAIIQALGLQIPQ